MGKAANCGWAGGLVLRRQTGQVRAEGVDVADVSPQVVAEAVAVIRISQENYGSEKPKEMSLEPWGTLEPTLGLVN